jgi:conjugation system TraG family ATPase
MRKIDEVFPILAVEEGLIISKTADITVPYELVLPEIFTVSAADYDRMHQAFTGAIQGMRTNYVVHKQDWYTIEKYVPDFRPFGNSPFTLGKSDERHFAERNCMDHRCLLFITRPMGTALKKRSSHSSLLSSRLVPKEVMEATYRQEVLETAEKFIRTLEESGLIRARRLEEGEIDYQLTKESIYQNYFSLSRGDTSMTDMELQEFKVGGQWVGVTAIGELSEFPLHIENSAPIEKYKMGRHFISGSLGYKVGMSLPFNHIYNQIYYIDNTDKLLKELEAQANRMMSLSLKSSQNLFNLQLKLDFIQKAVKGGYQVIRSHANVITWHQDRAEMLKQRSMVNAGFSSMNFTPRQAVSDAAVLYWSCIPGNAAEIGKDNLAICFAQEGACLLVLESNYRDKHYGKHGVKLTDRWGAPRCVDIFMAPYDAGVIDNRNTVFVGPSGSGKSFLMNLILYYLLEQDSNVIMVDTGNSYKRLCALMGGVYITFDKDHPLSFNPFYWDRNSLSGDEISDSKLNVASLLLSLWKKDSDKISKSEEVGIENLVNAYYEWVDMGREAIFPCFNSFFDFFQGEYLPNLEKLRIRPEDIDLENFRFVMERFYGGNYFGHLLNASPDNRINRLLEERFVVFEMDNIKNNPTLHHVTTMAIMTLYVRKLMRKQKAIFNLLIIEEAWRLVKDPRFAEFLKWVSKTARKHHGSLVTVTQEPGDLQSEVVKEAIIKNSAIKILLDFSQYKNQAGAVQEILGLSNEETALLMSVNQGRDTSRKYKEVFISWNGYAKVYGTEVSSESYATFTTKKDEVEAIEKLHRQYGSYRRAVVAFSRGDHLVKPSQNAN